MPHNRAHWIMRQFLRYARFLQSPEEASDILDYLPTQAHINEMIVNHQVFLAWASTCEISQYQDYDYEDRKNWHFVEKELFPHAYGTIEASFRCIDEYFHRQHCDSYYLIQTLYLPRGYRVPVQQSHRNELMAFMKLPTLLKQNRIPVPQIMDYQFRTGESHTLSCMRTFKKSADVRHKKRIDHEIRMANYFLHDIVPFLCDTGIMKLDTVPHVMKHCRAARPPLQ
jgi:hypothetical protein